MLSSSRFIYLCSISHSICSLIIFFEGKNMFFKISTSSVCNWALDIRWKKNEKLEKIVKNWQKLNFTFRIFRILMIASCVLKILSCIILSFSSFLAFSVDNCNLPMRFIFPLFCRDFSFLPYFFAEMMIQLMCQISAIMKVIMDLRSLIMALQVITVPWPQMLDKK